ncbi:MAG: UDP-3-O-(3-hydroxymyristoyl)glucosamine N-acyltransferase [Candidatus Lindowbacteria bacterium]|nr:UDP-3-O-(3-hydroxymyristoyl)glucosamine N-acyltransferase [Candidatus Lindowbacteria bacterium]
MLNDQSHQLSSLAELVSGRIVGNSDLMINGVSAIDTAKKGQITFAVEEKFLDAAHESEASCIIVPQHIKECETTLLQAENPRFAFSKIASLFAPPRRMTAGIHASSVIDSSATIGREVALGPHVVIDENANIADSVAIFPNTYVGRNVSIGNNTIIHANVTLEEGVQIGSNCIIHAGTVIGSDGFGFVENGGKHYKIPQIGIVIIEDNVEIGSNCSIDRAAAGATIIHSGTKMDNLIHIAHNVEIGHDGLIIAQVGISGSVTVGDNVIFAGQAGVAGHLSIGDRTVVAARAGVTKPIAGNMHVSGFPAKPHNEERKILASMSKLPELLKKVTQLTTAVQRLARRIDKSEEGRY